MNAGFLPWNIELQLNVKFDVSAINLHKESKKLILKENIEK